MLLGEKIRQSERSSRARSSRDKVGTEYTIDEEERCRKVGYNETQSLLHKTKMLFGGTLGGSSLYVTQKERDEMDESEWRPAAELREELVERLKNRDE